MLSVEAWLVAIAGIAFILASRWVILKVLRQRDIAQLVWIAPRGLITVLLFLSARDTGKLDDFPFGAVMLVVLVTAALTAFAHRGAGHAPAVAPPAAAPAPPGTSVPPQTPNAAPCALISRCASCSSVRPMAARSRPDHDGRSLRPTWRRRAMTHLLDPKSLVDDTAYVAALDELEDLMLAEPGTPAGRRFDELTVLIDEYEARRDGYDLARMRQALADSG